MQLSEFDFPFDPALIASQPVLPRDQARLFVVDRQAPSFAHRAIRDLPNLLAPGDLVVVNNTRVRPALVAGRKRRTGIEAELLFVRELHDGTWEVLVKGNWKPGDIVDVTTNSRVVIVERDRERTRVTIESAKPVHEFFRDSGQMPLPPYIKRRPMDEDREWYQTVFAQPEGAIAAPTAGLHFTPELLASLRQRGIEVATLTLHVGIGTFKPVTVKRIEDHRMGAEWVDVGADVVVAVDKTKRAGGRVVAVGTTVVRALETAAQHGKVFAPYQGETSLFLMPGCAFHVVDALLTNFHLPRTTLLMLVSALAGTERLRQAYEEAVRERYRFYSYGDAMLIV